jgi:hypothetical protein
MPRIEIQSGEAVPEKRPVNVFRKDSLGTYRFIIFLLCCLEALDRFMQHFPNREVIGTPFLTVTTFSTISCLFHRGSEYACEQSFRWQPSDGTLDDHHRRYRYFLSAGLAVITATAEFVAQFTSQPLHLTSLGVAHVP